MKYVKKLLLYKGNLFDKIMDKVFSKQIWNFVIYKRVFKFKIGLEVGGPSNIFKDDGFLPLYRIVRGLDGCNFANNTIWEGNIDIEKYNYYKNKNGVQFISEATNLDFIADSKYEFVISSNCLEHSANPLKAIEGIIRITKKGGHILLVLPNKQYCFDRNRPTTDFFHLLEDYKIKQVKKI